VSWWKSAPLAPQGQAQGQPAPVLDLRDPTKVAGDARDEVRTDIAVQGNERDANTTEFNQRRNYRSDFFSLPEVKRYGVIVNQYGGILTAPKSAAGDQARINSFSQMLNPTSTVMLGEYEAAADNQTSLQKAQAAIGKELKFDGSGRLLDESRRDLALAARRITANANAAYSQQRKFYRQLAERDNIDPFEIIGDHLGKPYDEQDRTFWKGNETDQQSGAQDPEMVGGLAKGTNITFAGDDGSGFDRNKWLMETTGFDPNGEANLVAWLGANSGNPNLTKEDVQSAYQRFSEGRSTGNVDDEFVNKLRSNKSPFTGFDSSFAENQLRVKAEQLAMERDTLGGATDAFVRGAAQVPSFGLADKAQALSDTVFNGGTYDENLGQQRLINTADDIANPYASIAGELTGAVLTPYGAGARTPMELAKVGAVTSGATEFNQSSAPFIDRLAPTALAAVTGGAMGYGTGKVVEAAAPVVGRFLNRGSQSADNAAPEMPAPEFIAAAKRQNVDYLPADIPGSNATQIATAITDKTFGSKFIQDGAQKSVNSVQNAVGRTTDSLGGAGDNVAAGQAAQRGANAWQDAADAKIGDLYDKIPIAPESVADTTNTLAALREVNNPIPSNSSLSDEISDPALKRYQAAMEDGTLSWDGLKKFRSFIGQKLGAPTLQNDIPKDRLKAIYAGLSSDLEATASKQGPQALAAFKRANTYKRAVETRRENVMGMLLGKKLDMSPEKTFAQLQSWAKAKGGDFAKLSQAIRSLPVDEANAVRATIIDTLGRATDGAQNSTGTVFSPGTFATRWNALSPRAKAVLFQGEHRADLDDIAGLSSAMKRADQYNNNSNTGVVVGGAATAASFMGSPILTTGVIGGQLLSGAILGSPRVAKWVAALYKKPNQPAMMAHIARLDNIAKAEPVIANEVFQLQTRLREAFGQGQMQLAANPGEEKGTPLPAAKTTTAGEPQ
jgi:hypothetical protein